MQIVAAIVLAALIFIAANHYVTRFGLLWWVAHTLVFALVLAFVWLLASMLFAPCGRLHPMWGRQPTRAPLSKSGDPRALSWLTRIVRPRIGPGPPPVAARSASAFVARPCPWPDLQTKGAV